MNGFMGNSKRQLLEVVSPRLQYTGVALNTPHHFSIESGTTYVVIGENGAGKSTLGSVAGTLA